MPKEQESDLILRARRRLHEQIRELAKTLDSNPPDFLVALFVGGFVGRLLVLCPDRMLKELFEPLIQAQRTRHSMCAYCDNPILPVQTHPQQCAACDAKDDENAAEIEAELAEMDREAEDAE